MAFQHIDTWVFDLDNTLYDADQHTFPHMRRKIISFISDLLGVDEEEASRIRHHYFTTHGTTLHGLMREHHIDPDTYLRHMHDFDISHVPACATVREGLIRLPGRKLVFTNSARAFAEKMLVQLDIADQFDAIFSVEDSGYRPKPSLEAYETFLARHGVAAKAACMFEDMDINLAPAHQLGMTTVFLHRDDPQRAVLDAPHLHHKAPSLPVFFQQKERG